MNWETVKIENRNKGRTAPSASIGFGRIALNIAACELLKDCEQYKYVEFLKARESGKLCIGLKFLKEPTSNSIVIRRREAKDGTLIGGMEIYGKSAMEKLFGIAGIAKKTTRFEVKKYEENILGILAE